MWAYTVLIDVDSVLGLLHRVDVGEFANVLEVHAAFIFRVGDRGSMHLQNVGGSAQNHAVKQPKNRINIVMLFFIRDIWRGQSVGCGLGYRRSGV
jgi:hypothetical protein